MAFFKEAPIKSLTRDRDLARSNRDRLTVRLNDAEQATISAKSLAQRAALDGDDGALDVAEATEHASLRRLSTIGAALGESEKLLALLESQIAEMLDKKTRTATALATDALADELVEVAAAYHASTSALNEVCTRALAVTMEANGLSVFLTSSLIEVSAAIPVVSEVPRGDILFDEMVMPNGRPLCECTSDYMGQVGEALVELSRTMESHQRDPKPTLH
jgi:hypothetical protein